VGGVGHLQAAEAEEADMAEVETEVVHLAEVEGVAADLP